MISNISILGSTGSIGTQALDVIRELKKNGHNININTLASHNNIKLLEAQIREFRPSTVAVYNEEAARRLKESIRDIPVSVFSKMEGLCEVASQKTDLLLNSVVGMAGLKPTISAIKSKNNIALANKETLVSGGKLVMEEALKNGVKILPVDSEHSAIFQCLEGRRKKDELKRIILTASGGPFFGKSYEELKNVSPNMALNHPNWNMGAKVSIDSATMMNKGLEIIEAFWLFSVDLERIDVLIHRESVIHSMIEYNDNSVIAQLAVPDMRLPIQYAITYPKRFVCPVESLDLAKISCLSFCKPDLEVFKCLRLAMNSIKHAGLYPACLNAANEEAVRLFLDKKIAFTDIPCLVEDALKNVDSKQNYTLDDVMQADMSARMHVKAIV